MLPQEEAIQKISLGLYQIFRKRCGRDPDSELIRAEAGNIVERYGPVMALIEIFSQDEVISGARQRPFNEDQA
jgi:hypothetical protein